MMTPSGMAIDRGDREAEQHPQQAVPGVLEDLAATDHVPKGPYTVIGDGRMTALKRWNMSVAAHQMNRRRRMPRALRPEL